MQKTYSYLAILFLIYRSPPGSAIPGILQARTLEWVAISFSNAWKWKVKVKSFSRVGLVATPWSAAYQAPPSMGFSRQEYWSGVPLPSPIYQSSKTQMFGTILCWGGWPQISLLRMQNNSNPWKGIWPHQTKFYMHTFLDPATLLEEAALKDTFIKLLKGFTQGYLLKKLVNRKKREFKYLITESQLHSIVCVIHTHNGMWYSCLTELAASLCDCRVVSWMFYFFF